MHNVQPLTVYAGLSRPRRQDIDGANCHGRGRACAHRDCRKQASATTAADDMMTLNAACAFFGGDKPLNPLTLYRGIAAKRFPKPVHVGPNSSRWLRSECEAARQALIAARNDTKDTDGRLRS